MSAGRETCVRIRLVLAPRAARKTDPQGSEPGTYSSMTQKEFVSYFQEDLLILDLQATTKAAAIEEIVAHLVDRKRVRNGTIVLEALKKRESLGSTGIGKSLAIPHGRTTVTNNLTVVFARSVAGI